MDQYVSNINYKMDLYRNIQEAYAVNGRIQEILTEQNEVTPSEIAKFINDFSTETRNVFAGGKHKEVYNLTLYTYNEKLSYDGAFLKSIKNARNEGWFIESKQSKNFYNYYFEAKTKNKQALLLLSQPILKANVASYSEPLGIIQMSLYTDWVFKPTYGTSKDKKMEIFILDKKGNIVYGDNTKVNSLNEVLKDNKGNGIIRDAANHKIFIYRTISPYNWKAISLFSYDEINTKLNAFITFSILVVVMILIISFVMTISFSRIFTNRIHQLINKMKNIESGDFNITSIIEGNDEVGLMDKHFNNMTSRLKILINENYVQQIQTREAELNALQLQINPHFLYNTLESISAIAAVNDCFEICSISQKLGDMFRYNINAIKNEFVFLRDEIEHIKNYIFIQKIRFEDRFEVIYDIPDELLDSEVLKFILQPIVENALIHGIEGKVEKGRILISAKVEEAVLYLIVEDDGIGIPLEKVEQMNIYFNETGINTNEKEYINKSIGLRNVNSRIKLVNGNKYGITVKSKLGLGTTIMISLPYCSGYSSTDDLMPTNGEVSFNLVE
jgi:two-component system, sensor histidine kinase YesM